MKNWIHEKIAAIFWLTLCIYTAVPAYAAPYAEVTTYAAGPVLLVSGALAWLTSLGRSRTERAPQRAGR